MALDQGCFQVLTFVFSLLLFQPQAVLFSLQETREDEGRNVERLRVLKDVGDSFHAMENEQVVCAAIPRRYLVRQLRV